MDVEKNINMTCYPMFLKKGLYSQRLADENALKYIDSINIKTPSIRQTVQNLSGGNQQKVVLSKWLSRETQILIFDEPTRGIDVGAKYEIYKLMNDIVAQGKTIILISSEMEELIGMSDRIIVLSEGKITGELQKEEFSQEMIMKYASGIEKEVSPE